MSKNTHSKIIATNKRAFFDFAISEKMETGIVLEGCEVKSIRTGHITIKDAYVRVIQEELWLIGCHITPYKQASTVEAVDPARNRKLLAHKKQICRLIEKTQEKGFTLIPLKLYFSKQRVKLEIGLGKSKKLYDKRKSIKDREIKRSLERLTKNY